MNTTRYALVLAGLAAPAGLMAQAVDSTTSGNYIVTGFGGTEVNGDVARAQQLSGTQRGLTGGIEALHFGAAKGGLSAEVDASGKAGDDEYSVDVRLRKGDRWRVNVGAERDRTYYDGSNGANITNGVFPTSVAFTFVDDVLYVDRSKVWVEAGMTAANGVDFNLRYEHSGREGDKSSTTWGTASGGNRKLAPAVNHINESTDTVSLDVKREDEDITWKTGVRWDHTTQENTLENVSGGTFATRRDESTADVVSGNAYVKKRLNERLTLSVGGLAVTEDSNLAGFRYTGATPGATTGNTYTALVGGTKYKEAGANAALAWSPNKAWTVTPSFRVSESQLEGVSAGSTTSGAGTNDLDWQEIAESIEARFRGFKDWSLNFQAESVQAKGTQINDLANNTRDLFLDQTSLRQKYTASAHWYFRPGLNFTGQYYYKTTSNDNDPLPGSQDYFINYQRFETHDANLRVSWRPLSTLTVVTRYDFRVTTVDSRVQAQPEIESSRNVNHVLSETITWQPLDRLYVTASASVARGRLELPISSTAPATNYVTSSDSDYISGSLGAGYVLTKTMDLNMDYSHYSADNVIDNSAASVVYGLDEQYDVVGLTWTIRPSAKVAYSVRYAYSKYSEGASLGQNDYEAHTVYAKAQYNF